MHVYRVCSSAYTSLDGEGARLYGGRWNNPGLAVIYTASSLALAILETRVHLRRVPLDYVRLTIEIPDTAFHPHEVSVGSLTPKWRLDIAETRRIGDVHFASAPLAPLRVPSIVVDTEWNILFSREYAAAHATVVDQVPIAMDPRLWSV